MIWLRHELWEHDNGLSYRLASRVETERLATAFPEGVIKHLFYAPSPAAAVAQYYALRHLGPYVPDADVSQDGFTLDQLQSQITDFPDDTILSNQQPLHSGSETPSSETSPEAPPPHTKVATPLADAHGPVDHPPADAPAVNDPRDLWPVVPDEIPTPRRARRRRKPSLILGFLRVVLLLIILAAVALGLCVATGTLDGPTLLAQARDLPVVGPLLP